MKWYVEKGKWMKDIYIFDVVDIFIIYLLILFLPMHFNFKICLLTKGFYKKIILSIRIKIK